MEWGKTARSRDVLKHRVFRTLCHASDAKRKRNSQTRPSSTCIRRKTHSFCVFVLDSGDGEVPSHPDAPGAGDANAQAIEKYGTSIY